MEIALVTTATEQFYQFLGERCVVFENANPHSPAFLVLRPRPAKRTRGRR